MKKIFSLFIALVFVITAFPLGAITTFAESTAVVTVESASVFAGKTVDVNGKPCLHFQRRAHTCGSKKRRSFPDSHNDKARKIRISL